jgi:hypothetical protein
LEFPMALLILISSRDSSSLDSLQLHSLDHELKLSIIRAPTASLSFIVLELAVSLAKLLTQVCCPIITVDFFNSGFVPPTINFLTAKFILFIVMVGKKLLPSCSSFSATPRGVRPLANFASTIHTLRQKLFAIHGDSWSTAALCSFNVNFFSSSIIFLFGNHFYLMLCYLHRCNLILQENKKKD